jgi:hypothetical protein
MDTSLPDTFDPDDAVLRYLIDLPDAFLPHSGVTLFQHLLGTYRLLKSWGCDEDTCLAGLFHSVCGTPAYRPSEPPECRRGELEAIIGTRAAALVQDFANIDWNNVFSSGDAAVREQSPDLVMLAAANFVEQSERIVRAHDDRRTRESLARYAALLPLLPPAAAARLSRELTRLGADVERK